MPLFGITKSMRVSIWTKEYKNWIYQQIPTKVHLLQYNFSLFGFYCYSSLRRLQCNFIIVRQYNRTYAVWFYRPTTWQRIIVEAITGVRLMCVILTYRNSLAFHVSAKIVLVWKRDFWFTPHKHTHTERERYIEIIVCVIRFFRFRFDYHIINLWAKQNAKWVPTMWMFLSEFVICNDLPDQNYIQIVI